MLGQSEEWPSTKPKVGAECLNWARSDLCGGRPVMGVPTAFCFGKAQRERIPGLNSPWLSATRATRSALTAYADWVLKPPPARMPESREQGPSEAAQQTDCPASQAKRGAAANCPGLAKSLRGRGRKARGRRWNSTG